MANRLLDAYNKGVGGGSIGGKATGATPNRLATGFEDWEKKRKPQIDLILQQQEEERRKREAANPPVSKPVDQVEHEEKKSFLKHLDAISTQTFYKGLENIGTGIEGVGRMIKENAPEGNPLRIKEDNIIGKGILKTKEFIGQGVEDFGSEMERMMSAEGERLTNKENIIQDLQKPLIKEDGSFDWDLAKDPKYATSQVVNGIYSMIPGIAAAVATGGGAPAIMGTMTLMEKGNAYEDYSKVIADAKGIDVKDLTPEDIKQADDLSTIYGGLAGVLETLPLEGFLSKLGGKRAAQTMLKRIVLEVPKDVLIQGLQEGTTEGLQQFTQNLLAQKIDPERKLSEGVAESAYGGFVTGGVMGVAPAITASREGNVEGAPVANPDIEMVAQNGEAPMQGEPAPMQEEAPPEEGQPETSSKVSDFVSALGQNNTEQINGLEADMTVEELGQVMQKLDQAYTMADGDVKQTIANDLEYVTGLMANRESRVNNTAGEVIAKQTTENLENSPERLSLSEVDEVNKLLDKAKEVLKQELPKIESQAVKNVEVANKEIMALQSQKKELLAKKSEIKQASPEKAKEVQTVIDDIDQQINGLRDYSKQPSVKVDELETLPPIGYIETRKGSDNKFQIFYRGTKKAFSPRKFDSQQEAITEYKNLLKKKEETTGQKQGVLKIEEKKSRREKITELSKKGLDSSKLNKMTDEELETQYQKSTKTQKEVVAEAIKEKPKTIKEIAEETKIKEPNIRRILGVGAKEGTFERVEKGVYILSKDGEDIAFVETGNAVESLPRLAKEGFKADMVFLDIPYKTPAITGGNRKRAYEFISVEEFGTVLDSINKIARQENSPIIHMFSQAPSGMKAMQKYNDLFIEKGFIPVGKGELQKTYKSGKPVGFPARTGYKITEPEGILVFTKSGKLNKELKNLNFRLVRPKGYDTEKPAQMLKEMIEMTTEQGDMVLDPFAGSGVALAEGLKAGRKVYGIEKSEQAIEEHIKPKMKEAQTIGGIPIEYQKEAPQKAKTAREVASSLIEAYVKRGDDIESLKKGGLGYYSDDAASIGGYVNGKKIPNDKIIVERINGKDLATPEIFSLQEIYDEISSNQESLFANIKQDITDTPAFRAWFGDSKVVDENGDPLVVYHGTSDKINIFSHDFAGQNTANNEAEGFYFSNEEQVADDYARESFIRKYEGRDKEELMNSYDLSEKEAQAIIDDIYEEADKNIKTVKSYLRMENPLIVETFSGQTVDTQKTQDYINFAKNGTDENGEFFEEFPDQFEYDPEDAKDYQEEIKQRAIDNYGEDYIKEGYEEQAIKEATMEILDENGLVSRKEYDGVIFKNVIDDIGDASSIYQDVYVIFDPNQVKSVYNEGGFSRSNDDIMSSLEDSKIEKILSEKEITDKIRQIEKETNPSIRKLLQFEVLTSITDKAGNELGGYFDPKTMTIALSRSVSAEDVDLILREEIGHLATSLLGAEGQQKVLNFYDNLHEEDLVKIFGQKTLKAYREKYKNNRLRMADEAVQWSLRNKDFYSKNKFLQTIREIIKQLIKVWNKISGKMSKEVARFNAFDLYRDVFNQEGKEQTDEFERSSGYLEELKARGHEAGSIKFVDKNSDNPNKISSLSREGRRPEMQIRSVPFDKIVIDAETIDALNDVNAGRKSMSNLPILVHNNGDGTFGIIDGRHRFVEQYQEGKRDFLTTENEAVYRFFAEEEEASKGRITVRAHERAGVPVRAYERSANIIEEKKTEPKKETSTERFSKIVEKRNELLKKKREIEKKYLESEEGQALLQKYELDVQNYSDANLDVIQGIKNNTYFKKEGNVKDDMGSGYLMEKKGRFVVVEAKKVDTYLERGYTRGIEIDSLASEAGFENGQEYLEDQLSRVAPLKPETAVKKMLSYTDKLYGEISAELERTSEKLQKAKDDKNSFYLGMRIGGDIMRKKFKEKMSQWKDRKRKVSAAKDFFGLSDNQFNSIGGNRNVQYMSSEEFEGFMNHIQVQAEREVRRSQARELVVAQIQEKQLKKTDNLRRAMKLPPIDKMTYEQLVEFDKALESTQFGDQFFTQRQIETVSNTELKGIKTLREAREKLAERLGVEKIEEGSVVVSPTLDRVRYDTALAEQNPFYKMLVDETNLSMLEADSRFLEIEGEANRLIKRARKSKKRGIVDKLVPEDKAIFEYLESSNKEALAKEMTNEELEAAEYIRRKFEEMRDYLVANQTLKTTRENYITHIRKDFFETWKSDGFVQAIKEIFDQQQEDAQKFEILSGETGDILPLEKFFQFSLRRSGELKPSENVAKAFLAYTKVFEKKRALDSLIPKLDIYTYAITPQKKTERGLIMDRSLKKFINTWINNKKGRRFDFGGFLKQGGKADISIKALKMFTSMIDLGLSVPGGIASNFGEQAANYTMQGEMNYAKGLKRSATAKGRRITDKYRNFVGKNPWKELSEVSKNSGDKFFEALFILFRDSQVRANKQYMLGQMTDEEYASETISPERLSEMKRDMGRWRVVEGAKSIVGSTSAGGVATQYKTWAIPILRSTGKNVSYLLKTRDFKSKQGAETLRSVIIVGGLGLLIQGILNSDDDDDSFVAQMIRRSTRDLLSIFGALDPTLVFSEPRVVSFLTNISAGIKQLLLWEQYKTSGSNYEEGDLKGVNALKRAFKPAIVKQVGGSSQKSSSPKTYNDILKEAKGSSGNKYKTFNQIVNQAK